MQVGLGLKCGCQRIVAEDDRGGIIGPEGLRPVNVFGSDDDRDVAFLEKAVEGKHECEFNRYIKAGAACI
jgi:hypothetical protein